MSRKKFDTSNPEHNYRAQAIMEMVAKFPSATNASLARMLYKENKVLFDNVEYARHRVRYYKDQCGGVHKKKQSVFKDQIKNMAKQIEIPASWAKRKGAFTLPKGYKKVGLISDAQAPFHDAEVCKIVMKDIIDEGCDAILMNGDMVDFYQLSFFEKDPRKRDFKQERLDCIEFLRWIKQEAGNRPVYYNLDANHEYRYERFMMKKAPELFSTELFMIEDLLSLHDIGIIPIRGYDHIKVGKLPIIHGHTIFRGTTSPVSTARTVFMKLKTSCAASHVHRVNQYTWRKPLTNEVQSAWTIGCLMYIPGVEYAEHNNEYVNGHAIITLDEKGNYSIANKMIIDGKIH
jgi:hypothetical protein